MAIAYFISDVHLGLGSPAAEREKQRRLLGFLDHASRDATHLFILGDLFDAWIEYRTVIPRGFHRVLAKLHDIADRGVDVHFLVGNHDFWVRDFFPAEMGIKTHKEAFDVELDGTRIHMHHGDGLDPRDHGYALLKKCGHGGTRESELRSRRRRRRISRCAADGGDAATARISPMPPTARAGRLIWGASGTATGWHRS